MKNKKLLLLIEDNPLLAGMYRAAFEKSGFEIVLAHDGESGVVLAKNDNPDGILLDLMMPGTDGFQVLERLKKDASTKNIKIIVLTSMAEEDDLQKAIKLGAEVCLKKQELTLAEIVSRAASFLDKSENN